jgi:hypothetical protein
VAGVSENVPEALAVMVRVTGVLTAQLPPTGLIVVVPEATAVIVVPITLATAGLELVRLVGLEEHKND